MALLIELKKTCIDCGDEKTLEHFSKQLEYTPKTNRESKVDGYRNDCKECQYKKSRRALLRRTTPEERKEFNKKYYDAYKKCNTIQ